MKSLKDILSSINIAIDEIKKGSLIIASDNEERENEGDIITSAQFITQEKMNFIISKAKGLVCAPMSNTYIQHFDLAQMVVSNTDNYGTKFTVSIDASDVHTGISAKERAETLLQLCDESKGAKDFKRPGHIFPLLAEKHGVLVRNGHTEASVDMMRLAGLKEIAAICEIVGDDGDMLRENELRQFSEKNDLCFISIRDLIIYRLFHEFPFEKLSTLTLAPTQDIVLYKNPLGHLFHTYINIDSDSLKKNSEITLVFDTDKNFARYRGQENTIAILHVPNEQVSSEYLNLHPYYTACLAVIILNDLKKNLATTASNNLNFNLKTNDTYNESFKIVQEFLAL